EDEHRQWRILKQRIYVGKAGGVWILLQPLPQRRFPFKEPQPSEGAIFLDLVDQLPNRPEAGQRCAHEVAIGQPFLLGVIDRRELAAVDERRAVIGANSPAQVRLTT